MKLDALVRAAQILRSQPGYVMPLAKLHACLAAELGGDAGTYGDVYRELKKRPHSFMVLDGPRLLIDAECNELLEGAGLGTCARVSLADGGLDGAPADALGLATATLGELWQRAGADAVLYDYLSRAAEELEEITSLVTRATLTAHPTIHPRDPHQ